MTPFRYEYENEVDCCSTVDGYTTNDADSVFLDPHTNQELEAIALARDPGSLDGGEGNEPKSIT